MEENTGIVSLPHSYFVRNDEDKQVGKPFSLKDAFLCAARGFAFVFSSQRNMKIHAVFILLALVLGFVLSIPLSSWIAIVLCFALVLGAECINTALESLVDLVSPNYHRLAQNAKDCAAAAVLISAIVSLVVAVLVFGSALGKYLM